jgi:hypothetical protein
LSRKTFDIDELSLIISKGLASRARSPSGGAWRLSDLSIDRDDLSLPMVIEPDEQELQEEEERRIKLIDRDTRDVQRVYRSGEERFLRCRIAVLGIGQQVEEVFYGLRAELRAARDLLVEEMALMARYQVALFGGQPGEDGVVKEHADLLVDRLSRFRPNYLALVNAGLTRRKLADRSAKQLALLTHQINSGVSRGQRPYALGFVTDKPVPESIFAEYVRLCQRMNTFPAVVQFAPHEVQELATDIRKMAQQHVERLELDWLTGSLPPAQ